MDKIEKFYINLLNNINLLIEKKNIDEAIRILEDEIESSYIPIEFYEKFNDKLLDLKFQKNYLNKNNKFDNFSKNDFFEKYKSNNFSEIDIIYFFKKFHNSLNDYDIDLFLGLLKIKEIPNNIKIVILENMKFINLEKEFIFINSNTNKETNINLKNIFFIESIDFFIKSNNILKEKIFKEPSLLELCYTIIYSFYQYFFPNFEFEYSPEEFIEGVINSLENMLQGKKIKNQKIHDILYKVITSIK